MTLATNSTCDIYRAGRAPPAAPDVAGAACWLEADYGRRQEVGEGEAAAGRFTHLMRVELSVDIRDDYDRGVIGTNMDTVWVPDQNGTAFAVVFVERVGFGTSGDHQRVYLDRKAGNWSAPPV
jgi:hypothetical protein